MITIFKWTNANQKHRYKHFLHDAIIKSSKPIKIRFNGTGFYNHMELPTFDGDDAGIPWQQNLESTISLDWVES